MCLYRLITNFNKTLSENNNYTVKVLRSFSSVILQVYFIFIIIYIKTIIPLLKFFN